MAIVRIDLNDGVYAVKEPDVKEGEQYRVVSEGVYMDSTGKIVGSRSSLKSIKAIEVEVIKLLADLASRSAKTIKDFNLCADLVQQMDNIGGGDTFIDMDKRDVDCLVKAFEELAGQRPTLWARHCRALFSQLESPKAPPVVQKEVPDQKEVVPSEDK